MRSTWLGIGILAPLAPLALLAGCDGSVTVEVPDDGTFRPPVELGRHRVSVVESRRVVPSAGLPSEVTPLASNNNIDVIRHQGRVYMAFRTAPDHFAGPETVLYVVSSADEITWDYETEFALETDLREPRFFSLGDTLTLYISVLGIDEFGFDPQGVVASRRGADGAWSELEDVYTDDTIVWRTKTVPDGRHFMTAYTGGEHIYTFSGEPLSVHFRTTTDGVTWSPVGESSVVYEGGGSETAFAFADDGTLYSVIRVEAEDATGIGSKICRASVDDITDWRCVHDRKKYDSPFMFAHDGEIYLIGRRNITETGWYDGEVSLTPIRAQLGYIRAPKRCSVWRIVQDEDEPRVAYITDLPSNGDTCFPSVIDGSEPGEFIVYDYTSDPDAEPIGWRDGQLGDTFLYRHVLRFERR